MRANTSPPAIHVQRILNQVKVPTFAVVREIPKRRTRKKFAFLFQTGVETLPPHILAVDVLRTHCDRSSSLTPRGPTN